MADQGTVDSGNNQVEDGQAAASASEVKATPAPNETAQKHPETQGATDGQAGEDWSGKYSALEAKFNAVEKSYAEARKKLNEQGLNANQYRKQLETLNQRQEEILKALSKATEKPYDPDQFMEELRKKGPAFFEERVEQKLTEAQKVWEAKHQDQALVIRELETESYVDKCKANTEKYPDFAKLEPEMVAAFQAGSLPFPTGPEVPTKQLIDSLYNFVRLQHSQDAIKAAEQRGRQKSEAELRREAESGVVGGGKASRTSTADPNNMNAAELRKMFEQKGMIE